MADCGMKWWKNLEKLPWSDDLVEAILPLGELAFLTSIGDHRENNKFSAGAAMGKVFWCNRWFPDIPLIMTHDKHFCAAPNAILIDDNAKKIAKFKKWGGNAFHWPSQYCFEDGDLSVEKYIEDLTKKIKII